MAGSVNKVILIGNLGKDPEIRSFGQSGDRKASFTMATSETWRDKGSGERREKTQWHNVVVMNENIIKVCESYLRKGSKVYVEGQIESRKYTDNQGQERYITEIVIGRFKGELTMLEGRGDRESAGCGDEHFGGGESSGRGGGGFGQGPANRGSGPRENFPADLDDEIPF